MKPPSELTKFAGKSLLGAGLLLDAPELIASENTKRISKYPEGYTGSREASLPEAAEMTAKGSFKSILNALTMGMAYAGTGKNRPKTGLGEMERSTDEMYRTLKERGDRFLKQEVAE